MSQVHVNIINKTLNNISLLFSVSLVMETTYCDVVITIEGNETGHVNEDEYKFLYSLGFDRRFKVHLYLVNSTAESITQIKNTMTALSANMGFSLEIHENKHRTVASAFLSHIISHHDLWMQLLESSPQCSETITCTLQAIFMNKDICKHYNHMGAVSEGQYLTMLLQDSTFNGCSKSFADDLAKHGLPDYMRSDQYKVWYAEHVSKRTSTHMVGFQSGLSAAQIDTMTRNNKCYYEKLHDYLETAARPQDANKWTLASWYYIIDQSPIDYALMPLYTTGLPTEQLIKHMELSIHNACRVTRKKVMIGVCTNADMELVQNTFSRHNPFIVPFRTPDLPDPYSHGILFCSCIQQQPFKDDDVIYFADGNPIIGGRDLAGQVSRLLVAKHGTYLSPHRLQARTSDHKVEGRRLVTFENREYVSSNSKQASMDQSLPENYYETADVIESYGSCFMMPFKAFRGVLFTVHHGMPRESACFSAFYHYGYSCRKATDMCDLFAITYKDRGDVRLPPYCKLFR